MKARVARAVQARRELGDDTDYNLYELICDNPGASAYELAKLAGWSHGRTHSAIRRLERDEMVRVDRAIRGGRAVLVVGPRKWWEFFAPEELEEFRNMEI